VKDLCQVLIILFLILKSEASYAEVGNVSIGNYPYLGLYGAAKYADYNGIGFVTNG
jgi:TonB-dependent starch-binding outer membrane protein SusC